MKIEIEQDYLLNTNRFSFAKEIFLGNYQTTSPLLLLNEGISGLAIRPKTHARLISALIRSEDVIKKYERPFSMGYRERVSRTRSVYHRIPRAWKLVRIKQRENRTGTRIIVKEE